jgi:adenylylsulfate kinase
MYHDTHARSVAKALSWRLLGTVATSALVYLFTRQWALSLAVGGLEFLTKIALFWLHERAWDRVSLGKTHVRPAVVWLTGLSGSGKSTVAQWVCTELRRRGHAVEHLDGDGVREIFPSTGFTRAERDQHIRRVGYLASKLEHHNVFVVASFVSPYGESRAFVRGLCRTFIEVHVATPLEECERRDVKGLYARARRGEIQHFTGVSDPYEAPERPELRVDTRGRTVEEVGGRVLECLREHTGRRPVRALAAAFGRGAVAVSRVE